MSRERNPLMVQYEERYRLAGLPLTNEAGTRWMHRMAASETYFNDYSWDWKENQELLCDSRNLQTKYDNPVMLARSIQQNFISSTYFRNPDPLIQDKGGNKDLGKMLSDVARAILAQTGSERKMKEGLEDQWWAGFGFQFVSFRQEADELADGTIIPRKQEVLLKRMSPYRVRFDPAGREWDMSDHEYVAVLHFPKLSLLMTDRRFSEEDRRRIMATYKRGVEGDANFDWRSVRSTTVTDHVEDDPRYIPVPTWQIWARPEKQIYTQIASTQFTLTPLAWPEEFEQEDCFPVVYMPAAHEPEDKESTRGFIGTPYIRDIKPHLYAINRLESQFLAANQNAIFKYWIVKGALKAEEQAKLSSDKQKEGIEFDPAALDAFPTQMREKMTFEDLFGLVKQPDLKELRQLDGIRHEMDMIAQIIGQAPGDRGGMPDSPTATDSIIVDKRLKVRENTHKHEAGGFFKQLLKLIFLVVKHRQELSIKFQMTTAKFNEKVWAEFSADTIRDLDLHYDYAVGSNEDRTREEEFALMERGAAIIMPALQASGNLRDQMKVVRDLYEMLNVGGARAEGYFEDGVQDLIAELTSISYQVAKGLMNPADPAVAQKQVELIAMLGDRLLTPDKMKQIVTQAAGAPEEGPGQNMGSIAKPPTPGESDFKAGAAGAAAAGAGGGMG